MERCVTGNGTVKQKCFENTLNCVSKTSPDHSLKNINKSSLPIINSNWRPPITVHCLYSFFSNFTNLPQVYTNISGRSPLCDQQLLSTTARRLAFGSAWTRRRRHHLLQLLAVCGPPRPSVVLPGRLYANYRSSTIIFIPFHLISPSLVDLSIMSLGNPVVFCYHGLIFPRQYYDRR